MHWFDRTYIHNPVIPSQREREIERERAIEREGQEQFEIKKEKERERGDVLNLYL